MGRGEVGYGEARKQRADEAVEEGHARHAAGAEIAVEAELDTREYAVENIAAHVLPAEVDDIRAF